MKHSQRILADRLLGVPLAWLFNGAARLAGAVLRRDHSVAPATVRQIVVAKLLGMGSAINASLMLCGLREQFPDSRIAFLTLRVNANMAMRLPCVDEVLEIDDRSVSEMFFSLLRVWIHMVRRRIDIYFDLEVYSAFASVLGTASLARNRVGFYRHSSREKSGLFTHLLYFNTHRPVVRLYHQLVRIVGGRELAETDDVAIGPIRVDAEDMEEARRALSKVGFQRDSEFVAFNANASDLLLERRWPTSSVKEAIRLLVQSGHKVVLLGSPSETTYVTKIHSELVSTCGVGSVFDLSGSVSIGGLLGLLKLASVVITNDTGPLHMAVALGRKTVCLFGPCHPQHYGHSAPTIRTIYMPVVCSPCIHEVDVAPCQGENICMQRISPSVVVQAALDLLEGVGGIDESHAVSYSNLDGSPSGLLRRDSIPV